MSWTLKLKVDKRENAITYLPFSCENKGLKIRVNQKFIEKNDKPWLPIMGEFHFSRCDEDLWERELLKIKACNVDIVATYVLWIYHEEIENHFDWSGNKNLRKFVELCHKYNMFVFLRPGPWAHAECRNGGFPDWLLKKGCKLRTNDPTYLYYARRWYEQIALQIKGLYFKDGGPIIGIQLENELYDDKKHIKALKEIAQQLDMHVPIYTVTGWGANGGAKFPSGEVIPSFGGYPEAPWEQHTHELLPNPNFFFTDIRNDSSIGNDLFKKEGAGIKDNSKDTDYSDYPYITCELGGGNQKTYHRRPVINSDDVASMATIKLGCGCNLLGYYMFHGGKHSIGKLTTLQESKETGYPNDYPVISYDFQAPIGQYGQVRPHYHKLRNLHMFAHDFGETIAPMGVYFPDVLPANRYDTTTPRMAVRSDGKKGFVFFANHQRYPGIQDIPKIQVTIDLMDGEKIVIPSQPFDLPKGAYFFWPFNLDIGGITLESATVQPLCKVEDREKNKSTYFFKVCDGVNPEYVFKKDISGHVTCDTKGVNIEVRGNRTIISNIPLGIEYPLSFTAPETGKQILIYTLTQQQAESCWKAKLLNREVIIISESHNLRFEGNKIIVYGEKNHGSLVFYPKLDKSVHFNGHIIEQTASGRFCKVNFSFVQSKSRIEIKEQGFQTDLYDKYMFMDESERYCAKQYNISWDVTNLQELDDAILELEYIGDVIQAYYKGQILNDDFYDGVNTFQISVKKLEDRNLKLKISPLNKNKRIYIQQWPEFTSKLTCNITQAKVRPIFN
ncbi:beta-galactosidase [Caldanaerobius polysaccharolyticus]|uniref:beta-galactosidase n=1 Tax=Caldanaerobius polysaccharolyticus TaxID=44256 RepID=UPI00047B8389|nr:beta-galactosidase [Caldanaerobius polysaccharolyticus]